jgi:hypothetical protein
VSRVVVLWAGIAGHTAAAFARRWLGRGDTVTVVSPRPDYNWVPSNIWVGVGLMKPAKVTFPLAPVYERAGTEFVQAAARELHPEGDSDAPSPYVIAGSADGKRSKVRCTHEARRQGQSRRGGSARARAGAGRRAWIVAPGVTPPSRRRHPAPAEHQP